MTGAGGRGAGGRDILVGVDAGTSVVKAVAFDLGGAQVAVAAVPNRYDSGPGGAATQPMARTYHDCAQALRALGERVEGLASRTAALAVTGQGDGTWLAGAGEAPVGDAWLWLDARAAGTVARLARGPHERARFEATGTGLNTCQQGAQMAHMDANAPDLLDRAEVALHCKDWLYLNLTGVRATDPSEAAFTFGDFRTRAYDDTVIGALGLGHRRHLLPQVLDGSRDTHPLTGDAARATGLRAGTPVSLGFVDMVMTGLGAGVMGGGAGVGCSAVGSTGVHMRAVRAEDFVLNDAGTGYAILLPAPGMVTQVQTNMAATLNLDWVLGLASGLIADLGHAAPDLVPRIEGWLAAAPPLGPLYHPYISAAGERGPFVDADARASLIGLSTRHGFAHLVRAVAEGLGLATRDCYAAMGPLPGEIRLTGGAARSAALRCVIAAATGAPVRQGARDEAGAAGAAMMAAVAIGAYPDMHACVAEWVTPRLGPPEPPDAGLADAFAARFETYVTARRALAPVWTDLSKGATA